jgi:hypothetical protein
MIESVLAVGAASELKPGCRDGFQVAKDEAAGGSRSNARRSDMCPAMERISEAGL